MESGSRGSPEGTEDQRRTDSRVQRRTDSRVPAPGAEQTPRAAAFREGLLRKEDGL